MGCDAAGVRDVIQNGRQRTLGGELLPNIDEVLVGRR